MPPRKISPSGTRKTQTIGYLRVSTGVQELDKNKADILLLANDLDFRASAFRRGMRLRACLLAGTPTGCRTGESGRRRQPHRERVVAAGPEYAGVYGDTLGGNAERRQRLCREGPLAFGRQPTEQDRGDGLFHGL